MSRRDDDGEDLTASGDGDDERGGDELSPEDEFRDWVGEAATVAENVAESEASSQSGWLGRVFSRDKEPHDLPAAAAADDSESEEYDPRLSDSPDELAIFSAVGSDRAVAESDVTDSEEIAPAVEEDLEAEEPARQVEVGLVVVEPDAPTGSVADDVGADEVADIVPLEIDGGAAQPDDGAEADTEPDIEPAAGRSGQATFADLWDTDDDADDDEDVIDFATFTSEDYLQATTREYVGLAEAVAKAEGEETQQIAVAAEIPGLESGLVGLDDVVGAGGSAESTDVIEPPATSDLSMRVLTAVGLLLLFGASLLSPYGIGALIVAVLGISAGELFAAMIRGGYRPLSIFGFAGIAGAFFGTWAAGPVAIPIALLMTGIAVFLFYATVPGRRAVLENATATLLVTAWIGGLGGLAFDIVVSDEYVWLILALVITVAFMDVAQYFVGRRIGKRPLAPVVSPKKTIEGYIAGVIVAVGVGAAFGWAEPFDLTDGLVIGGVVAIVAPFGDLAVSVVKRALGVKDMGYILPGHGGVLDRVDAMVMTIPALWLAYSWMGLIN